MNSLYSSRDLAKVMVAIGPHHRGSWRLDIRGIRMEPLGGLTLHALAWRYGRMMLVRARLDLVRARLDLTGAGTARAMIEEVTATLDDIGAALELGQQTQRITWTDSGIPSPEDRARYRAAAAEGFW